MKKVNMVLVGLFGATGPTPEAPAKQPRGRVEEICELKKMGLSVRRG